MTHHPRFTIRRGQPILRATMDGAIPPRPVRSRGRHPSLRAWLLAMPLILLYTVNGCGGSQSGALADEQSTAAIMEHARQRQVAGDRNTITRGAEQAWSARLADEEHEAGVSDDRHRTSAGDENAGADALPDLDERATIDAYLRFAALNSPTLEAAFYRWRGTLARVPQVSALPDPMLTYGVYVRETETRAGPMQHQISLAQRIPWFGTLAAREDAASLAAVAAFHEFDAARLTLFEQVRRGLAELWHLEQSRRVVVETLDLMSQIEPVLQTRVRVDAAGRADLIRVQIEIARLDDRIRGIEESIVMQTAAVNALLNRESDTALPPAPDPASFVPFDVDVAGRSTSSGSASNAGAAPHTFFSLHPEVLAQRARVARARVNQEVARLSGYPDLTFGLVYTVIDDPDMPIEDAGKDPVLATISVNVPIWRDKYDAAEREAIAERLALAAGEASIASRLDADLERALAALRDALRRIELHEATLIPRAREAFDVTLASLRSDRADLLDLLDTERTWIELQLSLARARADAAIALAAIDRISGTPLGEVTSISSHTTTSPGSSGDASGSDATEAPLTSETPEDITP